MCVHHHNTQVLTVQTLIMMIIAVGYSTYHLWARKGAHFNEKFAILYIGLFIAALVGNIIHTLRGGPIGERFISSLSIVRQC